MGGEVDAASDLYSLGAMLYEMVTGRPPFVGDESVAIIGQHLNTPPVAPTWHRPDCPPGLETLILRLLEKDPAKRPASATEVQAALASVAQSAPALAEPRSHRGERRNGSDNPLYRRTFVGREAELKQLQAAFDAALSGQGALVMVVGEPGIGKTTVTEQLATYVAMRGGTHARRPLLRGRLARRCRTCRSSRRCARTRSSARAMRCRRSWAPARARWRASSPRSATAWPSSCGRPATPRRTAGGCCRP